MINPFSLVDKRAVITGAGKGIGRGITLELARAGADVVISSRTESDLTSLAAEVEALGRKALPVVCDVTVREQLEELAAAAMAAGGIDIWVNNAGGLPDATPRYLSKTPLGRMGSPDDIGHAVVFLASPASSWITGQCLYVTGGL